VSTLRIESAHNERFKYWLDLQNNARSRRKSGLFLVEGEQECQYALQGGLELVEWILHAQSTSFPPERWGVIPIQLSDALFDRLAYRGRNAGCMAVFRQTAPALPEAPEVVLVLENAEKPGNLGALIRTALASGVEAVLATGSGADLYNPNCIRSSVGTVFRLPCVAMSQAEALDSLIRWGLTAVLLRLDGSEPLYSQSLPRKAAYVLGSEHAGLSDFWAPLALEQAGLSHRSVRIPMAQSMDSLNLSASAAVVLYEAYRQRLLPNSH